ncbi:hypothetical protein DFH07DRAFT_940453 [Mycena maculata]|uniref:Uncharacterized protein n=1 Tax=Mycena maculata TaxID=230809 RepID=A0AAD7J9B3_9AGAR|nr:hypothetical protein DFH07DRAFT_940453 [Mycena maculata]
MASLGLKHVPRSRTIFKAFLPQIFSRIRRARKDAAIGDIAPQSSQSTVTLSFPRVTAQIPAAAGVEELARDRPLAKAPQKARPQPDLREARLEEDIQSLRLAGGQRGEEGLRLGLRGYVRRVSEKRFFPKGKIERKKDRLDLENDTYLRPGAGRGCRIPSAGWAGAVPRHELILNGGWEQGFAAEGKRGLETAPQMEAEDKAMRESQAKIPERRLLRGVMAGDTGWCWDDVMEEKIDGCEVFSSCARGMEVAIQLPWGMKE